MRTENFDLARHGVDGGVGKLVTVNECTYCLTSLSQRAERDAEYVAMNQATGLTRFVIKVYAPEWTDQEIIEDKRQRIVAYLGLKANGLPVLRADVMDASCGAVRMQRSTIRNPDGERECAVLIDRAMQERRSGDLRGAFATCQEILEINRQHTDAMAIQALCLIGSNPVAALRVMMEALRVEPNDEDLYMVAADCAKAARSAHLAIQFLSTEIDRAEGDIAAAERLVNILLEELLVDRADKIVERYRALLPAEIAAKYFTVYDAHVDHIRAVAEQLKRAIALQHQQDWHGGKRALDGIVASGDPVVLLNYQICCYHLQEVLDLRTLLAIGRESNPLVRCASFTLALLSAARQQDVAIAAVAARVVLQLFENPLDLCGVPYWVTRDQHMNALADPVIAALHTLAALTDDESQRQLFAQAAQHYRRYDEQVTASRKAQGN